MRIGAMAQAGVAQHFLEKINFASLTMKCNAFGIEVLGSIRVSRVAFGVRVSGTLPQRGLLCSPNRVFRRDAGNCTRGRVRSPHSIRA
jgi:hypothetical protein